MFLTRDEILDRLKWDFDIKLTVRSFDHYRQIGLIPPIHGRKNRKGLYPDWTPELIKKIKDFQQEGSKLSDIRDFSEVFIAGKKIEKEVKEFESINKHRESWLNPLVRGQRIQSFLKIGKENRFDSILSKEVYGDGLVHFASFHHDHIDFYKVHVGLYRSDDIRLIEKKKIKYTAYILLVRGLVKLVTENLRIIGKDDIFDAIFA